MWLSPHFEADTYAKLLICREYLVYLVNKHLHIRGKRGIYGEVLRKRPPTSPDFKVGNALKSDRNLIFELLERVERLEREVFWGGAESYNNQEVPRLGRKPKLERKELLYRRDRVTSWLEQSWPNLSIVLRRATTSSEAINAIIAARGEGGYPFQPPFYYRAEEFEQQLWSFLKSGKFRGNPRNLAAAIAGLPELSWKRSFDICSSHPAQTGMPIEAYWDYMRRKFPDRLRELSEARTSTQVQLILSRSRTRDPYYLHLKEHPEEALMWLEKGKPKVTGMPSTPDLEYKRE